MKIVVLGTRGIPNLQGGVEKHCENLYPGLVKKGCEVIVLNRRSYIKEPLDSYQGVRLLSLKTPRNKFLEAFLHTFQGVFLAKSLKPDILHIHAIGPSMFAPLARLLKLKVVVTNHGHDYERKKWNWLAKVVLRFSEKIGTKWANAVICVSAMVAKEIRVRYKKEAFIIPNGVLVPQPVKTEKLIKKFRLKKEKYILAVGRLVPEKGFGDLIGAYKEHGFNRLLWKLVIAGDADHRDDYSEDLKKRAGEIPGVVLTGSLTGNDLSELYSHAGIFVLPSYHEGLPISLLEAMSYGLSCIASDISANREVPLDDERYFEPGNTEELGKKLKKFIQKPLNPAERTKQVALINQNYNWPAITEQVFKVYNRIIYNN